MANSEPEGTAASIRRAGRGVSVIAASVEAAISGRPWLVWVEGAAGSGKTTLLRRAMAGLPDGVV